MVVVVGGGGCTPCRTMIGSEVIEVCVGPKGMLFFVP